MHGTDSAKNPSLVAEIVRKYLEETGSSKIPILVRTPDRIYSYIYKYKMGKTLSNTEVTKFSDIANYSFDKNDEYLSRLGLYNDGYLGSATDLGTFKSGNRAKEVEWLSKNISRTPYGGEVVEPNDSHNKISNTTDFNTLDEMFQLNLSYLDIEWNDTIIKNWHSTSFTARNDSVYKNKTDFDYVKNHFGYRFLLDDAKFKATSNRKFVCDLSIKNIGFGNLNRTKKISVLFVKDNVVEYKSENVCDFKGDGKLSFIADLPSDVSETPKYEVFIRVSDSNSKYAIQFANVEIWNENLHANKLGEI